MYYTGKYGSIVQYSIDGFSIDFDVAVGLKCGRSWKRETMQSSLISKVQKANLYAQERDRVRFSGFEVDFRGEHNSYTVSYKPNEWHCSCLFFSRNGACSHTMAMEKILADMLTPLE